MLDEDKPGFSPEIKQKFHLLRKYIHDIDDREPQEIIDSPEMETIRELSKEILHHICPGEKDIPAVSDVTRSTNTYGYTIGGIIEKLFPLKPDVFIPNAFVMPTLCFALARYPVVSWVMAGLWVFFFLGLFDYPKRNARLLEWILAAIRFIHGIVFTLFLLLPTLLGKYL
ncbi:MAG: hypothetical protein LBV12_04395 [Puniceicoccales bacterium]|jgi:hypothetical protein|nr:hypothetical protein [Puniceicoccales bacterium]